MKTLDFTDKIVIVVGASRGIGKTIATSFGEAGAKVMVVARKLEDAKKVAGEIEEAGGTAKAYKADATKKAEIDKVVQDVIKTYKVIDVMVNNAGVNKIQLFQDTTEENFDWIVDVNLKGVYNGCRAVTDQMIKQGHGKILNTASQAAKEAFDFHSMYSASKFGVVGMTQVMAKELGKYSINVNCICPGIVHTDMWDQNLEEFNEYGRSIDPKVRWKYVVDSIPMKRAQSPEDMANAALFLCSDLAENITGQSLNINGGAVCS